MLRHRTLRRTILFAAAASTALLAAAGISPTAEQASAKAAVVKPIISR